MRQRVWLAGLLGPALLVFIAGIGFTLGKVASGLSAKDQVIVLDAADRPVLRANSRDARTDITAALVSSRQAVNAAIVKRPRDARRLYRYQFSHQGYFLGRRGLHLDIYSNYPLMSLGGLPLLGDLTWALDDQTYAQLKEPGLFLGGRSQGGDPM